MDKSPEQRQADADIDELAFQAKEFIEERARFLQIRVPPFTEEEEQRISELNQITLEAQARLNTRRQNS